MTFLQPSSMTSVNYLGSSHLSRDFGSSDPDGNDDASRVGADGTELYPVTSRVGVSATE